MQFNNTDSNDDDSRILFAYGNNHIGIIVTLFLYHNGIQIERRAYTNGTERYEKRGGGGVGGEGKTYCAQRNWLLSRWDRKESDN